MTSDHRLAVRAAMLALFPTPHLRPRITLRGLPPLSDPTQSLNTVWDCTANHMGNTMLVLQLPLLGADLTDYNPAESATTCSLVWLRSNPIGKWYTLPDEPHRVAALPEHSYFHCSLPKFAHSLVPVHVTGDAAPITPPVRANIRRSLGPVAAATSLLRVALADSDVLRGARSIAVHGCHDGQLSAENTQKNEMEALAYDPESGASTDNSSSNAPGALPQPSISINARFFRFLALHWGERLRSQPGVNMFVPFEVQGTHVWRCSWTSTVPLPDGTTFAFQLPQEHDIVAEAHSKNASKAALQDQLMQSVAFVTAVQESSPAVRADESLSHQCMDYPHLVSHHPLLPALDDTGSPVTVAFGQPAGVQASEENPEMEDDGTVQEHHPWQCAKPFNYSWTYWFNEFLHAVSAARRDLGFSPLRASVKLETLSKQFLIGFRSMLVVYSGPDSTAPEGVIYAAGPLVGCYPSITAADEAVCKSFFMSGAAHRAVLLGGPGFTFPGVHMPTNIGNLAEHVYLDPQSIPPMIGQQDDLSENPLEPENNVQEAGMDLEPEVSPPTQVDAVPISSQPTTPSGFAPSPAPSLPADGGSVLEPVQPQSSEGKSSIQDPLGVPLHTTPPVATLPSPPSTSANHTAAPTDIPPPVLHGHTPPPRAVPDSSLPRVSDLTLSNSDSPVPACSAPPVVPTSAPESNGNAPLHGDTPSAKPVTEEPRFQAPDPEPLVPAPASPFLPEETMLSAPELPVTKVVPLGAVKAPTVKLPASGSSTSMLRAALAKSQARAAASPNPKVSLTSDQATATQAVSPPNGASLPSLIGLILSTSLLLKAALPVLFVLPFLHTDRFQSAHLLNGLQSPQASRKTLPSLSPSYPTQSGSVAQPWPSLQSVLGASTTLPVVPTATSSRTDVITVSSTPARRHDLAPATNPVPAPIQSTSAAKWDLVADLASSMRHARWPSILDKRATLSDPMDILGGDVMANAPPEVVIDNLMKCMPLPFCLPFPVTDLDQDCSGRLWLDTATNYKISQDYLSLPPSVLPYHYRQQLLAPPSRGSRGRTSSPAPFSSAFVPRAHLGRCSRCLGYGRLVAMA